MWTQAGIMKLHIISDTHTKHRELNLPGGETLIHAGDFMSSGHSVREFEEFLQWMNGQDYTHKILIAGNHDRILEIEPELAKSILDGFPKITYLQDEGCTIDGINFYGSPWTPAFCGWAFQLHNDYEDTAIGLMPITRRYISVGIFILVKVCLMVTVKSQLTLMQLA